ncbi:MAG: transglycosylase [Candidatus Amoebophilus sp. 36-38]|nr:MAG: transglycosylase [Candidatus Amoebophilus sp. 36-38]
MDNFKQKIRYNKLTRYLWISFLGVVLAIPLYIFTVEINFLNLYGALPAITVLENPKSDLTSELYASDGTVLGKYFRYNRSPVSYEEISQNLINALLATEDYQFEQHTGIYLTGIVRAFVLSVLLQQNKGGGSTLTQQLAKNLFKTRSEQYQGLLSKVPFIKTIIVKTKEWIVSIKLERAYTKKEIITMYLNTVAFGNNSYGIKVAAKTFFNTTPDALTVEQAALLVGILRAPTYYSPIKHSERALRRRNVVLAQLYKYHFINLATYNDLKQRPIELQYKVEDHNQGLAPYFRSAIRDFLLAWTKAHGYDLFEDGLKIYTTIDSRLQRHAEAVIAEYMPTLQKKFDQHWGQDNPWVDEEGKEIPDFIKKVAKKSDIYQQLLAEYGPDSVDIYMNTPMPTKLFSWEGEIDSLISPIDAIKYNKRLLHTGFMAMDPHAGHIKAWVGGINFQHFKYDHVMQGKRQPGSAFKPIVYAAAIDNGYSPCYEVIDAPVTFKVPTKAGTWTPKNTNGKYTGEKMTLRQAMGRSVNSITAYIIKQIGPELVVDYARRLGIKSPMNPVPALCLGSSDVSIYELTGAYSTFMNKGIWIEPLYIIRIEDKHGRVLQEFIPQKKEAINEETAWLMMYMLKGAIEENGTFRGLSKEMKENNGVCGKTGTTSNHSDGWCIGMTKDLCTGVWVGAENRSIHFKTLATGQGAVTARPIWEKFMLRLYADPAVTYKKGPLPEPEVPLDLPCMKSQANLPTSPDLAQTNEKINHSSPLDSIQNEILYSTDSLKDSANTDVNPDEIF